MRLFRQARHPGVGMTQITHPKKLTQKMTHNGSVQHLFFCFTSKTRPWKILQVTSWVNGFFYPKISMVRPVVFGCLFPKDMLELSWQLGMFVLPRRTKLPTWGERNGSCVVFLGDGNSRMDRFFSFRNNWVGESFEDFLFSTLFGEMLQFD